MRQSLGHSLPFLHHGAELVTGQVHTMEVGQNSATLNLLSDQLELAVARKDVPCLYVGEWK